MRQSYAESASSGRNILGYITFNRRKKESGVNTEDGIPQVNYTIAIEVTSAGTLAMVS